MAKTVLVVDDDPTQRRLAQAVLEREGYAVVHAESGGEAIDRLTKGGGADVVLLDMVMPGMSGLDVTSGAWDPRSESCFSRCITSPPSCMRRNRPAASVRTCTESKRRARLPVHRAPTIWTTKTPSVMASAPASGPRRSTPAGAWWWEPMPR